MPATVVKNVIGLLIIFMLVYQNKNAQIKKDDRSYCNYIHVEKKNEVQF